MALLVTSCSTVKSFTVTLPLGDILYGSLIGSKPVNTTTFKYRESPFSIADTTFSDVTDVTYE